MSESNKCCEKCNPFVEDELGSGYLGCKTPNCPCHSTTPSLEGFKTLIYNLGVAGGVTTSAAIEIKEYAEILLDHQQAEAVALGESLRDHSKSGWGKPTNYTAGFNDGITTYQKALKLSTKK